jgi:hypothetical protein
LKSPLLETSLTDSTWTTRRKRCPIGSPIDTSMPTAQRPRREEFPPEPAAALGRARELVEDVSYKTVLISEIPTST